MTENHSILDSKDSPVLIVDDNLQYAKVLERILKVGFGYTDITHVDNTNEAFERISKEPNHYLILFIDYNFPTGDTGGKLFERLQKADFLKGKAAFLITSEPSLENIQQATQAGAVGVVAKPFNSEQLREQLDKARRALYAEGVDYF